MKWEVPLDSLSNYHFMNVTSKPVNIAVPTALNLPPGQLTLVDHGKEQPKQNIKQETALFLEEINCDDHVKHPLCAFCTYF